MSDSKKSKQLRIAVVGCGGVSRQHVMGWLNSKLPVKIVALCDIRPDNARKVQDSCKLGSAQIVTDYGQVLADPAVDVVEICTPSDLHTGQIMAALQAGKHIMTEKPVGYSLEDCRKLRWYRREFPQPKVGVAYSLRYFPTNQAVKRELERGTIGKVMYASVAHNHAHEGLEQVFDYPTGQNVSGDLGGRYIAGSELAHATHPFDFARWLFGEVVDVLAIQKGYGVFATFRHAGGATSHVIGGAAPKAGLAVPYPLCIQGTKGTIVTYQVHGKASWSAAGYRGWVIADGKQRDITPKASDTGHGDLTRCRNFYNALVKNEPLICDMDDAIRTSELLHAVRDAHDHEIRVPVHRTGKTG